MLSIIKHKKQTLFCRLQTLDDVAHLRFIRGDYLGISLVNNVNVPCLVNWRQASVVKLRALPDLQVSWTFYHVDTDWWHCMEGWSSCDAYVRWMDCRRPTKCIGGLYSQWTYLQILAGPEPRPFCWVCIHITDQTSRFRWSPVRVVETLHHLHGRHICLRCAMWSEEGHFLCKADMALSTTKDRHTQAHAIPRCVGNHRWIYLMATWKYARLGFRR